MLLHECVFAIYSRTVRRDFVGRGYIHKQVVFHKGADSMDPAKRDDVQLQLHMDRACPVNWPEINSLTLIFSIV